MKKTILIFLVLLLLLPSCAARETVTLPEVDALASVLLSEAEIPPASCFAERLDGGYATMLGMDAERFEQSVAEAVVYRPMVDADGRELYLFRLKSGADAGLFAGAIYESYEFPPCDRAKKLVISYGSGYVIMAKASEAEADALTGSFCRIAGTTHTKTLRNHG